MANTNVKPGRAPRVPKTSKAQPGAVEIESEDVVTTPDVLEKEALEVAPEPEVTAPEQPVVPGNRTTIYLVQKGEKFNVYRDVKKLTRKPVSLEKARLIACTYGESNPTIQ